MKRKLITLIMITGIFSVSEVFAQDAVTTKPEKVEPSIKQSPNELKLRIEQLEVDIEPLKTAVASGMTVGSDYKAKIQNLDEMIAEWEELTGMNWKSESPE